MKKKMVALATLAVAGAAHAAPLIGSTGSVSAFCSSQGGCGAPVKSATKFMTTPVTSYVMPLRAGPVLSVGRVQGDMIILASIEVKKAVRAQDWKTMAAFTKAFSGQTVTSAQLSACMTKVKDSLRRSPGYARVPLTYASYGRVEMTVECFARPLADRSGYGIGLTILPAGE